jgi:hypothetical protein
MKKTFDKVIIEKLQAINACCNLYRLDKIKIKKVSDILISHLREVQKGNWETIKNDKNLFYELNGEYHIKNIKIYSEYKHKIITIY